jgi:hypothetical protein
MLGTESAVTVTFAAEGTAELMGTAALEGNSFALAQDTCSDREVTGTCTIEVRFSRPMTGQHGAILRLSGARGEAVVTLTAAGRSPRSRGTHGP